MKEPGSSLRVLQYHNVTPTLILGGTWVPPRQFARHVREIQRLGLPSVDPKTWDPQHPTRGILWTFDDGFEGVYRYAFPILERWGIRAMVFVVVNAIGRANLWDATFGRPVRHLTRDELHALHRAGWQIGSHSLTHPDLTYLSSADLRREVIESKARLEDLLGEEVQAFCYPFGRWNAWVREMVQEAGYRYAFSSRPYGTPWDPLAIPRIGVYLTDWTLAPRLDVHHPFARPYRMLQRGINAFSRLSGLARHRAPWLARLAGMRESAPLDSEPG